jgi:hypothetical protein
MASNSPSRQMGEKVNPPAMQAKKGLAGVRRPPPLNTSTSPPRWSTPASLRTPQQYSPQDQNEHKRRSSMYTTAMRWFLEVVFLFVIPSCSSWFCCLCIPIVLPLGFVMFASPPAFLEAAIANWTLRQVVFYAVWWVVGPLWVTTWALRSFREAMKELKIHPPNGLLIASSTLPVFLTAWWWGLLW